MPANAAQPAARHERHRSLSSPINPQMAAMIAQQAVISQKRMSNASDDTSRMAMAAAVAAMKAMPEAIQESVSSALDQPESTGHEELPQLTYHDPAEDEPPRAYVAPVAIGAPEQDDGAATADAFAAGKNAPHDHHASNRKVLKKKQTDAPLSKVCSECPCAHENTSVFSKKCKDCGHKH